MTVFHCDLYRLNAPEQAADLGLHELVDETTCVLLEWAENGGVFVPSADVQFLLSDHHSAPQQRQFSYSATTPRGSTLIDVLAAVAV